MNNKFYKIRAIIFDIDGTLVDSFPAFYYAFNNGIRQFDIRTVSKEFLAQCLSRGLSLREILHRVFPINIGESVIESCKKEILGLFLKVENEEVRLFPGVKEIFEDIKGIGMKIGIATGRMTSIDYEWERFRRFGIDKFIDVIVTCKEVQTRKPEPDVIIECAKRLNVAIEECIVVGDTKLDIIAAKKAGAIPVLIVIGQDDKNLLEGEKPEFIVRELKELIIFLKNQWLKGGDLFGEGGGISQ